jgi:hypothetical protein
MQHRDVTFIYSLKQKITLLICWANSRVGASTIDWHCGDLGSMSWRMPIEKVAVFPVPDCACAIVSFLPTTGRMPRCWMIDGFSKPKAELAKMYRKPPSAGRDWGSVIQSCQLTSNPMFNWFTNLLFFLFLAYYK